MQGTHKKREEKIKQKINLKKICFFGGDLIDDE